MLVSNLIKSGGAKFYRTASEVVHTSSPWRAVGGEISVKHSICYAEAICAKRTPLCAFWLEVNIEYSLHGDMLHGCPICRVFSKRPYKTIRATLTLCRRVVPVSPRVLFYIMALTPLFEHHRAVREHSLLCEESWLEPAIYRALARSLACVKHLLTKGIVCVNFLFSWVMNFAWNNVGFCRQKRLPNNNAVS